MSKVWATIFTVDFTTRNQAPQRNLAINTTSVVGFTIHLLIFKGNIVRTAFLTVNYTNSLFIYWAGSPVDRPDRPVLTVQIGHVTKLSVKRTIFAVTFCKKGVKNGYKEVPNATLGTVKPNQKKVKSTMSTVKTDRFDRLTAEPVGRLKLVLTVQIVNVTKNVSKTYHLCSNIL